MKLLKLLVTLMFFVASMQASLAQFTRPAALVVVEKAERRMLAPSVEVPGTVISRLDSRLASELAAKISWIAEIGARIKKGEAVAKLEDINFRLLEMEAASEVDREKARVSYLASEVERLQRLATQNNAAQSLLEKTISELGVARSEQAIAEARLGRAKVAMYITEIRAPFDGVVTERLRSIGERLNVADEVIRLVDPDSIEIVARAPLNTVSFISEGDELLVGNDYKSGSAVVRVIVPFGNPQSHMFEVRLDIDAARWVVGESTRVAMPTSAAREVLTVPRDALVLRREGASVFKIDAKLVAHKVPVITGQAAGTLVEVIGDVEAGDTVVIRGAERLEDGMTVTIGERLGQGAGGATPAIN